MSRLERCSFVAIAALVATLAIGCSPVTQLLVVVRSDLPADDIAEVQVAVVAGEPFDGAPTTRQVPIGAGEGRFALPFSFGVLPRGGDARSRVELLVTAIDRDGEPTVSRLVRTGFSEGRTLAVPVFLGAICRDRMCGEGLTCVDGACVSPEVPVEDLVPVRPGEELGDASRPIGSDAGADPPDTGTPSTVGFPAPTRASGRDVSPIGIVRRILVDPGGDLVVVVDATGEAPSFGDASTLRPSAVTVVARLSPELVTRWVYVIEGEGYAPGAAWTGDRVFVCGSFDGTLSPDGLAALGSPDDGTLDLDDAAYLLELDARTGTPRTVVRLASGQNIRCNDANVSGTTLALGVELDDGTLFADSTLISLAGCPSPSAALLRFDLGAGVLTPMTSPTFGRVLRGGITATPDGSGGFSVGLASDRSGDENVTGGCGAGGAVRSADVVVIDPSGGRGWARHALEVPEGGVVLMGVSLTTSGDRVVMVANVDAADTVPFSIARDGSTVSGPGTASRLAWVSLRSADGDDGRIEVATGSVGSAHLVGREPDVAVCGQSPWFMRPGVTSDLFGLSPPSAEEHGFVVAMDPSGSARWLETSSVGGAVSTCARDLGAGLWVAPFFLESGTFRGVTVNGSAIVHLEP
jgi:hypothetical protein